VIEFSGEAGGREQPETEESGKEGIQKPLLGDGELDKWRIPITSRDATPSTEGSLKEDVA